MSTSTVPAAASWRGDEAERDQAARLEHQEVARRVGLDRGDPAQLGAVAVAHRGADQLVHPQRARHLERLGLEVDAVQALGRLAVAHALELHDEAILAERLGRHDA